jgi:3-isopropylmalate/(R)-2-methylmalate dehydratase small subunit
LIKVSPEELEQLMEGAERGANATMTVDLESQEITNSDGEKIIFEVDSFKKHCLLNGLDDIGLTLKKESSISAYEKKQKASEPWLYA